MPRIAKWSIATLPERSGTRWLTFALAMASIVVSITLQDTANAQQARGQGYVNSEEGTSSREARENAIRSIPFAQLNGEAGQRLKSVIEDASFYRRLPIQTVDCDPEMYAFLVRHPEIVVGIWDLMGITKVSLQRIDEYRLTGNDGAGTTCNMDLVFGNDQLHIYHSSGVYSGNLWARELKGRCVVVLHNKPGKLPDGKPGMVTWMDAFMKLENVGADLVVKTLGPLVGKTADHNFLECAGFFSQISMTAESNPHGLQQIGKKLVTVQPKIRDEFIDTGMAVAIRAGQTISARQAIESGIATSLADKGMATGPSNRAGNRLSQVPVDKSTADSSSSQSKRIVLPTLPPEKDSNGTARKANLPSSMRKPADAAPNANSSVESSLSPTIQLLNSGSRP